jgi:hypothetical protein
VGPTRILDGSPRGGWLRSEKSHGERARGGSWPGVGDGSDERGPLGCPSTHAMAQLESECSPTYLSPRDMRKAIILLLFLYLFRRIFYAKDSHSRIESRLEGVDRRKLKLTTLNTLQAGVSVRTNVKSGREGKTN